MNRIFSIAFIFIGSMFTVSGIFAQQKVTVYDQSTGFPIHDVQAFVVCSNEEYESNEIAEDLFTNKKGRLSSDFLMVADVTCLLVFVHESYITKRIHQDSLSKMNFKVYLESNANTVEETVVSASRRLEKKKDVIQKIRIIRNEEIQLQNQSSMADLIGNSGNVFVQKSQLGGGSPIIRGFETNKVLMVVDGVRMNNAIYRGGHLQNIITLDNSIMDRVEVLFGPGSVIYGSDAIGGVMSFKTKDPKLSHNDRVLVLADAFTRYFSAANGFSTNVHVSLGNKKFGSLSSFTFSKFGDLRQGSNRTDFTEGFGERNWYVTQINGADTMMNNNDPNVQIGSGYQQFDMLQKFVYKQKKNVHHTLNLQLSNSGNIDRYDRLTQVENNQAKFSEWYYGPQFRWLSSYTLSLSNSNNWYDESKLIVSYQSIEESRMVRRFKETDLKSRVEGLDIFTVNLDFSKQIYHAARDQQHKLNYGLDAFYNSVDSRAFSEDMQTGTISALDTRYPDGGSRMYSFALYMTDTWEISEKTIANMGIRGSHVGLNANFIDQTFFPFPFNSISQRNSSINGNLGLIYMPKESVRFTLSAATGFRAPNVDDVSKVFESVPGKVIVPNPSLKPEYSYNLEWGSEVKLFKTLSLSMNVYGTYLSNALTVQPGKINGSDSVFYDGSYSEVITTTNASQAFLYGLEGVLRGHLGKHFDIFGTVNYTYGRILTDSVPYPLDHIPPVYGKLSLDYHKKHFSTEAFLRYSGWKRYNDYNLVGEDNYAFALPEEGMPSWFTLNIRLNYAFSKNLSLQLACENILDRNYRSFASNISAPGRNFIVTIRGHF